MNASSLLLASMMALGGASESAEFSSAEMPEAAEPKVFLLAGSGHDHGDHGHGSEGHDDHHGDDHGHGHAHDSQDTEVFYGDEEDEVEEPAKHEGKKDNHHKHGHDDHGHHH
ncbi:MAG: hypothetical protein R3208_08570 [Ketobacteraceae bacterium]|nr:hypothetical protein [Ketobacteraceae bacterium]